MAAITAVGYGEYERAVPQPHRTVSRAVSVQPPQHKDYSRPLHVDCSVEYELPNAAKPPAGARSEPLLMIHPCYYRRAESQRRSPFVNNLPPPPAGRPSIAAPAAPPLAAPAAPAHYPTQMRCYNADPRQASVAPPPKLCPSMDMHSGRWTSSIQHSPRLQHPVCHDSSGVATPCTANVAATAPVDDKINLPGARWSRSSALQTTEPTNQTLNNNQTSQLYYPQLLSSSSIPGDINNNNNNGCSSCKQSSCRTKAGRSAKCCQQAAASCRTCQPAQLQQRSSAASIQQSWPGLTAPALGLPPRLQRSGGGGRAVDTGPRPQYAVTASSLQRRQVSVPWTRSSKRTRSSASSTSSASLALPMPSTSSSLSSSSTAPAAGSSTAAWLPPLSGCNCKVCQQWRQSNHQVQTWNNANILGLFNV